METEDNTSSDERSPSQQTVFRNPVIALKRLTKEQCSMSIQAKKNSVIKTQAKVLVANRSIETQADNLIITRSIETQADNLVVTRSIETQADCLVANRSIETQADNLVITRSIETQVDCLVVTRSIETQTENLVGSRSIEKLTDVTLRVDSMFEQNTPLASPVSASAYMPTGTSIDPKTTSSEAEGRSYKTIISTQTQPVEGNTNDSNTTTWLVDEKFSGSYRYRNVVSFYWKKNLWNPVAHFTISRKNTKDNMK